jgi:hypothetical protein
VRRGLPICLLTLAATLFTGAAVNATSAATHPSLRLTDASSVTLRGAGFKRHERVRVTVTSKVRAAKSINASTTGAFVVEFAGMNPDTCAGFSATAVGSDGSRATFKRAPGVCPSP